MYLKWIYSKLSDINDRMEAIVSLFSLAALQCSYMFICIHLLYYPLRFMNSEALRFERRPIRCHKLSGQEVNYSWAWCQVVLGNNTEGNLKQNLRETKAGNLPALGLCSLVPVPRCGFLCSVDSLSLYLLTFLPFDFILHITANPKVTLFQV